MYYRREPLRSVKTFLLIGVGPTLAGLMLLGIFIKSVLWQAQQSGFFRRRAEVADPALLEPGG